MNNSTLNSTKIATNSDIVGTFSAIIALNSLGSVFFLILLIVMISLLIVRWKSLVFNKKLMNFLLIFTCLNHETYQLCGIGGYTTSLIGGPNWLTGIFLSFEFSGYLVSLTLCLDCQAFITRILYGVYFHSSQSWMRNGKNAGFRRFVLISTIILVIIFNLQLILSIPYAFVSTLIMYVDSNRQIMNLKQIAVLYQVTMVFHPSLGSLISVCLLYLSILNFVIVTLLVRKLINNQTNPITEQKRKLCRNLKLLLVGQIVMALLNTLSVIIIGIATGGVFPLYVFSIFMQKTAIFLFCLCVNFSFGPLDSIVREMAQDQKLLTKKESSLFEKVSMQQANNDKRAQNPTIHHESKIQPITSSDDCKI